MRVPVPEMLKVPLPVMRRFIRSVVRPILGPNVPVSRQRVIIDTLLRVALLPSGTTITPSRLGGRDADRIVVSDADETKAILFLHGGGYTVGSRTSHRAFATYLAAAAGVPVYLLDYRLAPENKYPAALDDAVAAYEHLLGEFGSGRVAVAGDSAGGGLAVAVALRLRAEGVAAPAVVGLVSPWVDVTLTSTADLDRDPMLRVAWLGACASRYAGDDTADPLVSPLFADLAGLPPLVVQSAEDEILLPDIERFVARAQAAGVSVQYQRLAGLWHVVHLHAGMVSEATAAVTALGEELGAALR